MVYKCKNCGSAVIYDAGRKKLVCEYCNSEFTAGEIENSYLKDGDSSDMMESNVYVCSACGATLMTNDVEAATFCAFCGQPAIVFDRVSKVKKPDYIIPFKITKDVAYARIKEKMAQGKFIPSKIKKITPDVVRGIYIPFSMSDVHYEDREILRSKASGKGDSKCYYYRQGVANFKNLPVDCSVKFNDESAKRLEPFPDESLKEFNAAYLSGFYADMGDEKNADLHDKIYRAAGDAFHKSVEKTIKADYIEILQCAPKCEILETKYVLAPVWFFACNTENFRCTIMVNGYTGKVIGAVPVDKKRVAALFTSIFIPLLVVFVLVFGGLGALIVEADIDLDGDIIEVIVAGISAVFFGALAKFKALKKSIGLSSEADIFELAKNREEGQK